jgi:hypothetical protein
MFHLSQQLNNLSDQVRRGETAAAGRLRRQLEPALRRLVRHALRSEDVASPLARRVRAEIAFVRAGEPAVPSVNSEALAERITASLCDRVIARLRRGGRKTTLWDTLRPSEDESVLEMSCAS